MVSSVDSGTIDDSTSTGEVEEGDESTEVHPNVQKYIDAGVISYQDAKACGFLSNPENAVLLALFETARQRGLKLELHRVDTQTGTFEFKIKSANEKLNGAIVSLVMTVAGSVLGLGVGFGVGRHAKANESSGVDNMGSLAGGAILQCFKSGGEVGEAAIGVNAAEYQAFADMFEQNYQAISSDVNHNNDSSSGIVSGMR